MQFSMGRGGYNAPNEQSQSQTPAGLVMFGRGGYNGVNDGDSDDEN